MPYLSMVLASACPTHPQPLKLLAPTSCFSSQKEGSYRRLRLPRVEHTPLCCHLPCPGVTRIQLCVVLGCGSSSVSTLKGGSGSILGAEPEASGQGPSTPLCSKLQLQNQAVAPAPPWSVPVRLRSPPRRPVASLWVTPGAQHGHHLYLPPCWASEGGCELTAGRARTPGRGARAASHRPAGSCWVAPRPRPDPPAALAFTPPPSPGCRTHTCRVTAPYRFHTCCRK